MPHMEAELRQAMVDIGRRAYARGLVAASEGNFSARLERGRILCTPTFQSKGRLNPETLCILAADGRQLAGPHPPSSEIRMHHAIYAADPSVQAVVHAHPPFATTFAVLEEPLPRGILPEAELLLGEVPITPYATTGTQALADAVAAAVQDHSATLLSHHGAVAWSRRDLETAYHLMEALEAVARVVYQARQLGTPQPIPDAELVVLAERRRQLKL